MSRTHSFFRLSFCGAAALSTMSIVNAASANVVTYVGAIHVPESLGRIVADPVRNKVYGLAPNGDVYFMNGQTLGVDNMVPTGWPGVTDIDVAPDGSFMTVLDNVTREYWGQPPATYVLKFDLNSQTQTGATLVQSPLFHMALGRTNRIAGVGCNQWVNVYEDNSQTGSQLSSTGGGYFGSNSTDWNNVTLVSNPAGTRMYRTDIGISAINIMAFDISSDTIQLVGSRGVGSYNTVPIAINSSGSSLYVGNQRVNPNDVNQVLGIFPETILAGTGDDKYAFSASKVYDPALGSPIENLPAGSAFMTLGSGDQYLFALDSSGTTINVMRIAVPEPGSATLALGAAAMTLVRRRRRA